MRGDVGVAGVQKLSEQEKAARFDELQVKLGPLWRSIERLNQDPQTIVIVRR